MREKIKKRKKRTLVSIFVLVTFIHASRAQIDSFYLSNPIYYSASKRETMIKVKSEAGISMIKVDSVDAFTIIKYKRDDIDSAIVTFINDNFYEMEVCFSDSCLFHFCNSYFSEKKWFIPKKKPESYGRRTFYGKDYIFSLTRPSESTRWKYVFYVGSVKHRLKH